jgi:hypothetical protein
VGSQLRLNEDDKYNRASKFNSGIKIDSYNDMEADNIDEDVDELEE